MKIDRETNQGCLEEADVDDSSLLTSLPVGEWPSCRYCIFRDADFGVCIRKAPKPATYREDAVPDDSIDYASWPLANVVCGEGLFVIGDPPIREIVTYEKFVARHIRQENEVIRQKRRDVIPNEQRGTTKLGPVVKGRMYELFREGMLPKKIYDQLHREFGPLPFKRQTVYWHKARNLWRLNNTPADVGSSLGRSNSHEVESSQQ